MKNYVARTIAIAFLINLFFPLTSFSADSKTLYDPFMAIDEDFSSGNISLVEKLELKAKLLFNKEKLPQKYSENLSSDKIATRLATIAILELQRYFDILSPETQLSLSSWLDRPTLANSYVSPSGFFRLHFDLTGVDSVASEDLDLNGTPDYIDRVASYLDTTLNCHLDFGYLAPPSDESLGGDDKYDVYFIETGFYGYAVAEGAGNQSWSDRYSYVVMNNDYIGFPENKDPEGQVSGAAKATAAHEFHHAVQFGYDSSEETWLMESDATFMEDICFDLVDDNYNYLFTFVDRPDRSLMESSPHWYSTFIWEVFLAEKFDSSLMVAVWEGARYDNWWTSLSDSLLGRYGWTTDSAFSEFANWNFITGSRNDNLHYDEATEYNTVSIYNEEFVYPVNLSTPFYDPAGYGCSYINFFPSGEPGILTINFNGSNDREWSAYLIKSVSNNSHEFEKLTLDPITFFGSIEVPNFNDYERITLVGSNLSEDSFLAVFTYSASIDVEYLLQAELAMTDSVVYSGGTRGFDLQVTNPSNGYDIYTITASSDDGWVTLDSLVKSLGPNQDTIFSIPISPPQGTPLGQLSAIKFNVRSWGDSTVTDTIEFNALTVLQRGDMNFTGSIDIADLTYLVNYFFKGGPPPQPITISGDFDCSTEVNVSDLTDMVNFLFKLGPDIPCKPY